MTCSVGAVDAGNVGARRAIDKGQAGSACRRRSCAPPIAHCYALAQFQRFARIAEHFRPACAISGRLIAALQALGVRIAIDDVGTGHSGLSYMLKLGVDIIKIDKMFVDAIGTDRNFTTVVETLVDLAHNIRMDVVAEGVENFEQVMHLH